LLVADYAVNSARLAMKAGQIEECKISLSMMARIKGVI
jgi:hypothetical protein